jgi:hypothetical protein
MRQALDRGARISRQLLVFARRQALLSERVDAAEQLRGMRSLIAGALRPDIELRLELPAETLPVELDSVQFEVALLNLAVNARDAMPRGGRFVVRAEARRLAEPAGLADGLPGGVRRGRGDGYRHRHGAGRDGARLRALLHHQASRPWDRARPGPGLWLRPAVRRDGADRQPAGRGDRW